MGFLAGYGIYIGTLTDRFVGRMLDAHAKGQRITGHRLFGAFDAERYIRAQAYRTIGRCVNPIRIAISEINIINIPQNDWTKPKIWKTILQVNSIFSNHVCAKLAATALEESTKGWSNECRTFCCKYEKHMQED